MADDLFDFRGKVTGRTHQVLAAIELASGRTQSEVVREILDQWAAGKVHEANVIARLTRSEGADMATTGDAGK